VIHLLFGILLFAGGTMGGDADAIPPDQLLSAPQVLNMALSRAMENHITPFLKYNYTISMVHKGKAKSYRYSVLERMQDHYARFTGVNPDGTLSQDIHLHSTLVSPGLFLNSLVDDSQDEGPKQIGRVVASPYTASLAGIEAVDGCSSARHLILTPKGDAERHALREIWADVKTNLICRAIVHKTVNILSRTAVLIDMQLDENEFVKKWSFSGTGHTVAGPYTLDANGLFSEVETVASAEPAMFK
jgi:hypothetical protein